jgi:sugar transferase (PEP-CTERM system associated)
LKLKFKKLMLGDLFLAGLSFYLALRIRFNLEDAERELFSKSSARPIIFITVLIAVSHIFEMYSLSKQRSTVQLFRLILYSVSVSFIVLTTVIFMNPGWMIGRGLVAISLVLFVVLQASWHLVFRKVFGLPYLAEKIIVVGTDTSAQQIGNLVTSVAYANHYLIGFIGYKRNVESETVVPPEAILGDITHLPEIASRFSATKIIVINPQDLEDSFSQNILLNSKLRGLEIVDGPTYFETVTEKLMLEKLGLNDLIYSTGFRHRPMGAVVKRIFDIAASITGLLLLLPVMPLIMLLVKINSHGPVLYRQTRVGFMGKSFTILKFRSMETDAEQSSGAVWAQQNDPRLKPIGRFLRKSRLDEVPQLLNVLAGNMSIIGPRPERPEFVNSLQEQIPFYGIRHFLKPGISGWAQIKYPYGASIEDAYEKLRYDLYYFKHMNLILDSVIFLKTIKVVFSQFGGR